MDEERASRKVRMSPDLMALWAFGRTADGYLLTWEWGEPDAEGFYEPAITRHEDDRLVAQITEEQLAAALRSSGAYWSSNATPAHARRILAEIETPT